MVWIAAKLGISLLRVWLYAGIIAFVSTGALIIRQHYIDIGWEKHKVAVEKQDGRTKEASRKVDEKIAKCQEGVNGYWDVVTKGCKLEDEK